MPTKTHVMHGRDHAPAGADPIPGVVCQGNGPPTDVNSPCSLYYDQTSGLWWQKVLTAPLFRSVSTAQNDTTTATLPIALPAGAAVGDLLLGCTIVQNGWAYNPPTGWTVVQTVSTICGVNNSQMKVSARVVDGTEPATLNFTGASAQNKAGVVAAYSGTAGSTVAASVDVSAAGTQTSGTSMTAPTVTTTGPNRTIVVFGGAADATYTTLWLPGSGYSKRAEIIANGSGDFIGLEDGAKAAAGATGAIPFPTARTPSLTPAGFITVALTPPTAGGFTWIRAPVQTTVYLNGA